MKDGSSSALGTVAPKGMLFPEGGRVLEGSHSKCPFSLWEHSVAGCLPCKERKETNSKSWFLSGRGGVMGNVSTCKIAILRQIFSSAIPVFSSQRCCGKHLCLSTSQTRDLGSIDLPKVN